MNNRGLCFLYNVMNQYTIMRYILDKRKPEIMFRCDFPKTYFISVYEYWFIAIAYRCKAAKGFQSGFYLNTCFSEKITTLHSIICEDGINEDVVCFQQFQYVRNVVFDRHLKRVTMCMYKIMQESKIVCIDFDDAIVGR